jgi:ethanolamine ammonia-lyase small subunit
LLTESYRRQLSGVDLKDETGPATAQLNAPERNFLIDES